jgi:hypothetical protein
MSRSARRQTVAAWCRNAAIMPPPGRMNGLERRQVGLALVDRPLEHCDLLGADADHASPRRVGRGRELAPESKSSFWIWRRI